MNRSTFNRELAPFEDLSQSRDRRNKNTIVYLSLLQEKLEGQIDINGFCFYWLYLVTRSHPNLHFLPFKLKATTASRTGSMPLCLMFKYRYSLILPVLLLINEDISQGLSLGLI